MQYITRCSIMCYFRRSTLKCHRRLHSAIGRLRQ